MLAKTPTFNSQAYIETIYGTKLYWNEHTDGQIRVYIPHLPEEIELNRDVDFNVTSNLALPDGLALYERTSPQEIPIEFSIHAFDPLCEEGPKTLLATAAKLFAMALPTGVNDFRREMDGRTSPLAIAGPAGAFNADKELSSEDKDGVTTKAFLGEADSLQRKLDVGKKFPPACKLVLLQAGANSYGIACSGFIKSVKVRLKGPWLQTTNSDEYNLPSSAVFSFVFVHNPYYTNSYQHNARLVNAYGPDVLDRLYNTLHLTRSAKHMYVDVDQAHLDRFNAPATAPSR